MFILELIRHVLEFHHHRLQKPDAPLPGPMSRDEAEATITQLAADFPESVDVEHSIVDVMKVLGLDSSKRAREQLAHQLGYEGPIDFSPKMNLWLRDKVMDAVATRTVDSLRA
jgi:hypothetical protein